MAKVDLDETEASLAYLEYWMKIIKELRAAREVVERLRHALRYDRDPEAPRLSTFIGKALIKYDEATK